MIVTRVSAEQLAEIERAMAQAVDEVDAMLAAEDVDGANDYCDVLLASAGRWAHDELLRRIGATRGQPHWRTYR